MGQFDFSMLAWSPREMTTGATLGGVQAREVSTKVTKRPDEAIGTIDDRMRFASVVSKHTFGCVKRCIRHVVL